MSQFDLSSWSEAIGSIKFVDSIASSMLQNDSEPLIITNDQ